MDIPNGEMRQVVEDLIGLQNNSHIHPVNHFCFYRPRRSLSLGRVGEGGRRREGEEILNNPSFFEQVV